MLISVNVFPVEFAYPLGMSVVANLLSRSGYKIKQFDFFAEGQSYDKFVQVFNEYLPDIVTISIRNATNISCEIAKKILNIVHSKNSRIKIILGGAGFSIKAEQFIDNIGADYGFVGQAEDGFVEFVQNIADDRQDKKIVYSRNNKKNIGALYNKKLLKFYNKYPWSIGLSTKRGCKYKCLYCQYKKFDDKEIKYRDIDDVISDIKFLKENGIENIMFTDSIFNDDSNNYVDLIRAMIKQQLNIKWFAYLRPKHINDEILFMMKKSGLCAVNVGIDASTDETLVGMQKEFSWIDVETSIKLLKKYDICTVANIIFGGPNETEHTLAKGIVNVQNLKSYVNEFDIKIFLGREYYNPTISNELIENILNNAFGKKDWYLPLSKEK